MQVRGGEGGVQCLNFKSPGNGLGGQDPPKSQPLFCMRLCWQGGSKNGLHGLDFKFESSNVLACSGHPLPLFCMQCANSFIPDNS